MEDTQNVSAIRTRYYGPNGKRDAIIAVSDGNFDERFRSWRLTYKLNSQEDNTTAHRDAAQAWLDKYLNEPEDSVQAVVSGPGLTFKDDEIYFTWKHV